MSFPFRLAPADDLSVAIKRDSSKGVIFSLSLRCDGSAMGPSTVSADGRTAISVFSDRGGKAATVEDVFEYRSGTIIVKRKWTIERPGRWNLRGTISVAGAAEGAEVFVPAVLYRGNETGKGAFPKRSLAASWTFAESRTPVPCCALVGDDESSLICGADPATDPAASSCAEGLVADGLWSVAIETPGQERPYVYSGKKSLARVDGAAFRSLLVSEDQIPLVVERAFYCRVSDVPHRGVFGAYADFVRSLPPLGRTPAGRGGRPLVSWDEYRSLKSAHLLSLVEPSRDGKSAYLAMGRNNGDLQHIYRFTAGSFLVKSVEGALVLAREGTPDTRALPFLDRLSARLAGGSAEVSLLDVAERIGRFFLAGELGPGVHQDCSDPEAGLWGGYLGISENDEFRHQVNARCNGETMKSYIRLYETMKSGGRDVPEFLELPKRVARFYLERQLGGERAGSFGRWWSTDGRATDSLGTNGAYVASFLIALVPHLEDLSGIDAALAAAGNYYAALARRGDFYADTLDADSCDKEAGAVLLTLFLDLFEYDGDGRWLESARDAADFLLSWIWQYDCLFPQDSPLGSRGFSTRGMTSVSVAHHHLDFYGMSIAFDFLRFANHSGDRFFRDQAIMMLRSCRQLVADAGDTLGRTSADIGWQPEQISHTDWDYFDRPSCRNGTFDIDIAWVSVLGLGAYQRIREYFPDALDESGKDE